MKGEKNKGCGKAKAIICLALAAIMIASVFAAMAPTSARDGAGAIERGDVVFCGERSLDVSAIIASGGAFYGMTGTTAEGALIPVPDNTDFNVPLTANEGPYNATSSEGTFADMYVDEPEITGDVFIEGTCDSIVDKTIPAGTKLTIRVSTNFGGLMKNAADGNWSKVKIRLIDPYGIYVTKSIDADAPEITVGPTAGLNDVVWDKLDTTGWILGTWRMKITTDKGTCNEVDVSSLEYEFTIRSEELSIEAAEDEVGKGDDIILRITGNPITYYYLIVMNVDENKPPRIEDSADVRALSGNAVISAQAPDLAAWLKTGSDGIADVKVDTHGADTRIYTIEVYDTPEDASGPLTPEIDWAQDHDIVHSEDDDVQVTVVPATITFDMPTKAIIGETVKIKGTISAGDTVDILIDDGDIEYFDDVCVDEYNEFEVEWNTLGLTLGSYTIDVYIDCPYDSYDEIEIAGINEDGKITIRLIYPLLTVNLSTNITQPRGTIVINGTAMGTDHVDLITISPGGGNGSGLYEKSYPVVPGITNESIPVENNSFSKIINVSGCATLTPIPPSGGDGGPRDSDGDGVSDIEEILAGTDPNDPCDPNPECAACLAMRDAYIIWVSVPGRDGEYGVWSDAENASELIKHIIDDYCGGNVSELRSKTRDQILAILQDATIYTAGSDDEACVMYLFLAAAVFDTGSSPNPYPSISGTHNGTITPNQTINVSKLYTYSCAGTGGHTESIEIYENKTLIANGTWNGYIGDYHNITIHNVSDAPYVMLLDEHKYNYTIRTGSYPQIVHEPSYNATGGTITCTSFEDANGKKYDDWIPAIRLWTE